jgi:hypothetical protein
MQQPEMIRQARERQKEKDLEKSDAQTSRDILKQKLEGMKSQNAFLGDMNANPLGGLNVAGTPMLAPSGKPLGAAVESGMYGQYQVPEDIRTANKYAMFNMPVPPPIQQRLQNVATPGELSQSNILQSIKQRAGELDIARTQQLLNAQPTPDKQTEAEFWRNTYLNLSQKDPSTFTPKEKLLFPLAQKWEASFGNQNKPSDVGIMQNRILSQMRSLYGINWDANVIPLEDKIDRVNKHGRALYPDTWQDMTVDDLINADIAPEDAPLFNAQ